ncbi:MAG: hypothetical protein Q4D95_01545 [Peptoniphilus sp.]|nr:hypothetical protein [Peptoniphilus sp.]
MKKRGFTYIVTIMTVTLMVLGATFILSNLKDELLIMKNQRDYIQADAYAESMINIAISEENLEDHIKELYHTGESMDIVPTHSIEELEDCRITLKSDDGTKKGFLISAKVKYKGVEGRFFARGSSVNPLYLKKLSVLNPQVISQEEIRELKETFVKAPMDELPFVEYINLDERDYFIKKEGRYFLLYRESAGEEEVLAKKIATDTFHITQKGGSLCVVDDTNLKGIVDVDNIFLRGDLNLSGILVLRSPVNFLNNPKNIYVKGLVINGDGVSENNVVARYDFEEIDLYSQGIPNYIKARVYSIKRSIDNK